MKTIDTKSLLLGVFTTSLILLLTSSKAPENENLQFVGTPNGIAIFNNGTKTIYQYKGTGMTGILDPKPYGVFKVTADGSSLTREN
jgi:hypothetical protein